MLANVSEKIRSKEAQLQRELPESELFNGHKGKGRSLSEWKEEAGYEFAVPNPNLAKGKGKLPGQAVLAA